MGSIPIVGSKTDAARFYWDKFEVSGATPDGGSKISVNQQTMAKGARIIIQLECGACKSRNYTTFKNRENTKKLVLKKYCPQCRKHTEHQEVKITKK